MACNCGNSKATIHQVKRPDGTVKRYASEAEARAASTQQGYDYTQIKR